MNSRLVVIGVAEVYEVKSEVSSHVIRIMTRTIIILAILQFCWDKTAEADMRQKALDLASSVNSIPGKENPADFLRDVVEHLKVLNGDRLIDFNWDHIQHQMDTSEITWTERDPPRD